MKCPLLANPTMNVKRNMYWKKYVNEYTLLEEPAIDTRVVYQFPFKGANKRYKTERTIRNLYQKGDTCVFKKNFVLKWI